MSDNPQLELVRCAYEECGTAYNTAVDVSLFTWKIFYTRSAAALAAAGYIVLEEPECSWIAVVLLVLSATATWFVTRPQMLNNQAVIRKVIAAGVYLESEHQPNLGCRFKLDAFGNEDIQRKQLSDLWIGPRNLMSLPLSGLGVTPKVTAYCTAHALTTLGFALIAAYRWLSL